MKMNIRTLSKYSQAAMLSSIPLEPLAHLVSRQTFGCSEDDVLLGMILLGMLPDDLSEYSGDLDLDSFDDMLKFFNENTKWKSKALSALQYAGSCVVADKTLSALQYTGGYKVADKAERISI